MNKLFIKTSVLSISLLTVMASAAVSPALAKIKQAFPGVDITLVKLILTIPSLLIIPFSLLSGWLARRMSKKHVLLLGLFIYLLAGVAGGFAKSVPQLLIIRAIFGIGAGLIIPLSTSIIADLYEGPQRVKMMGYSGSVSHFGGVIFILVSGWLACVNWRYSFLVYSLSILVILTVIFWLPALSSKRPSTSVKSRLPGQVFLCGGLGVLVMISFYAAPTNLAMFIENQPRMYVSSSPLFKDKQELLSHLAQGTVSEVTQRSFKENGIILSRNANLAVKEPGQAWSIIDGNKRYIVKKEAEKLVIYTERLGRPGIAGYLLSTMTLVGVGSGIILSWLMRLFGPFSATVGLASMAAGYALLGSSVSLLGVFFGMLCIGFSSGILMPLLLLRVARITPQMQRAMAMAVVSIGVYLGQFLSPVVLKAAGSILLFGQDPFRAQFNFLFFGLAVATIIGFVIAFINIKNPKLGDSGSEGLKIH